MMYTNTTDVQYVFDTMVGDGFKHFKVINASGNLQLDQQNPAVTPEQAVELLKKFLTYNRGMFTIVLRKSARPAKGENTGQRTFYISNTNEARANENEQNRLNGMGSFGMGPETIGMHDKISELQERIVQMNLEHQEKLLAKERELMEMAMKMKSQNDQDTIMGIGSNILLNMFGGGGKAGIQGIGDDPVEAPAQQSQQPQNQGETPAIAKAIMRLKNADPDFEKHITALANLAEQNKTMYDQGVAMIEGFVK